MISSRVGLINFRAVTGVAAVDDGVFIVPVEVTVDDPGVKPEYELSAGVPSLLRDVGAGGARYDLRLCRSMRDTAHSCRSTGVRLAACTKWSRS